MSLFPCQAVANPALSRVMICLWLVEQFSSGEKAIIRFHDFIIEEFDVEISLKNFGQAISTLMLMQPKS